MLGSTDLIYDHKARALYDYILLGPLLFFLLMQTSSLILALGMRGHLSKGHPEALLVPTSLGEVANTGVVDTTL